MENFYVLVRLYKFRKLEYLLQSLCHSHLCFDFVSLVSLIGIDEVVNGIYNRTVGSNSMPASPGDGDSIGNYPPNESPGNACDNNVTTKYLNFGACLSTDYQDICGLNTGFYLTLQRGASLVNGLQICTANDSPDRDPLTVTLEGSNSNGTDLTLGASWNLIYSGSSGLDTDPGRYMCGAIQVFCNSIQYTSYRFLVQTKRSWDNSVQYSEFRLLGY